MLKVREGGPVVNVHALLATGLMGDGHREILGPQVTRAGDGAGWLGFFRDALTRSRMTLAPAASTTTGVDPTSDLPGAQRLTHHQGSRAVRETPRQRT